MPSLDALASELDARVGWSAVPLTWWVACVVPNEVKRADAGVVYCIRVERDDKLYVVGPAHIWAEHIDKATDVSGPYDTLVEALTVARLKGG